MTENVVEFSGVTKLDIPVEIILRRAAEAGLTSVLVLGWYGDEVLFTASTTGNVGKNLELCETFKHQLLAGNLGGKP